MLKTCPSCGKYTVYQPCYECLKKERDELKALVNADVVNELKKYKMLHNLAAKTCSVCRENCLIRDIGAEAAATVTERENPE